MCADIIGVTSPGAGKLTVWLDGEPVKEEENVNAGQLVNVSFSGLSEETHHVSATVRNDAGYSPVGEAFQYVGNDTPKAVTDLLFTEQGGTATLTWNLPETGVEEGYINPSTILDVDGDGRTWYINNNSGYNLIEAEVSYTEGVNADNWLLTPKMKLQAACTATPYTCATCLPALPRRLFSATSPEQKMTLPTSGP